MPRSHRRRPGGRASRRHRPPRSEARQHHADGERRQTARLRPRQAATAATRKRYHQAQRRTVDPHGDDCRYVQYMAPEQLEGRPVDERTDIFAFGAVLYEMLTGRRAFDAASQAALITSILRDDPPSARTVAPALPSTVDLVIRKCLAKDPEARWQSAEQVRAALAAQQPRNRPWLLIAAILLVAAAVAAIVLATVSPGAPAVPRVTAIRRADARSDEQGDPVFRWDAGLLHATGGLDSQEHRYSRFLLTEASRSLSRRRSPIHSSTTSVLLEESCYQRWRRSPAPHDVDSWRATTTGWPHPGRLCVGFSRWPADRIR